MNVKIQARKVLGVLLAFLFLVVSAPPASAETFNNAYGDDTNDFEYIYSGSDIDYFEIFEDTAFPGELNVSIYYKGNVSRSRWMGSDDYAMVYIDVDLDGVEDYYIPTSASFYPADRNATATGLYRADNYQEVAGCGAQTWVSGGYSSTIDNWVSFSFIKDCVPMGPEVGIQVVSNYLGYFDYTDFYSANTGVSQVLVPQFERPSAKQIVAFKTPTPAKEPDDLVALSPSLMDSIVMVSCSNGFGSGWAADVTLSASHQNAGFRTVIITNNHVVENCLRSGQVQVKDKSGNTYPGTIFANDPTNDLAGIFISAALPKLNWQGEKPAQGWWVGVLGSPLGIEGYLSTGIVGLVDSNDQLGVTAGIRPGNSGGPVFDRQGRVIGVATAYISDTPNINIAGGASLLCNKIITCPAASSVWSTSLQASPSQGASDSELSGETIEGGMLVQRAGSQVFVTSADLQGNFELYEDGQLVSTFTFNGISQAHIVDQRLTGAIQIRKIEGGSASLVSYEMTKALLWFQNINLGAFSATSLGAGARDKVLNLVNHKYFENGVWTQRDSNVTKFICTGIYREGANSAEKLEARKKAKLACDTAAKLDTDPNSQVSFFYQTKPTKASSYVGKVLVTVKGIEQIIESRLNG